MERCLAGEAEAAGTVERCLACEAEAVGTVERCLACEKGEQAVVWWQACHLTALLCVCKGKGRTIERR